MAKARADGENDMTTPEEVQVLRDLLTDPGPPSGSNDWWRGPLRAALDQLQRHLDLRWETIHDLGERVDQLLQEQDELRNGGTAMFNKWQEAKARIRELEAENARLGELLSATIDDATSKENARLRADVEEQRGNAHGFWDDLVNARADLAEEVKQSAYYRECRDLWRTAASSALAHIRELDAELDKLEEENAALQAAVDEVTNGYGGSAAINIVKAENARLRADLSEARRGQLDDPEQVARLFHEEYERLADSFSYKTRTASAVPWEQVPENNRRLMVATVKAVQDRLSHQGEPDEA